MVLSGRDIVIGFIHPLSGPLAAYGAADSWIIDAIRATPQFQAGFTVGGKNYPVTIKSYDTRSDAGRAGRLASQAITADKVDLIVTAGTTQTVIPVTAVAEKLGTPAIGAAGPGQAWYAGLGGNPAAGQSTFKPAWVTLYGPGASDLTQTFVPMWNKVHGQVSSDLTVACLFPADADGDALRAAWPAFTGPARYTMVDPAAGPAGQAQFGPLIGTFKARHCDLFTNAQTPQDFGAFWKQAAAQGYQPKLATVTGGLQFPSEVTALGPLARNVALAAWWAPNMPRTSSLTGQTGAQLAAAFTAATGSPWVQSLSNYSLFEVAHAALTAVNDPHHKAEVAQALSRSEHRRHRRVAELGDRQRRARGGEHPLRRGAVAAERQGPLVAGGGGQHVHAGGPADRDAPAGQHMSVSPASPPRRSGGVVRQVAWASVPVWSIGFLSFVPFGAYALSTRRPRDWAVFGGYLAATIAMIVALSVVSANSGADGALGGFIIALAGCAAVHTAVLFRPRARPAARAGAGQPRQRPEAAQPGAAQPGEHGRGQEPDRAARPGAAAGRVEPGPGP